MSKVIQVINILEDDLNKRLLNIMKKPKTAKLLVGPHGQLNPKQMNLEYNLGINPTGMFTKSQVHKVFRTK
jgi:hypothetical protein